MREHKKQQYRICTSLVGRHNSSIPLMLGHGFGVSSYPQFYDRIKTNQMLPRPYLGSYIGEKGHQFLQEPWIIALAKSVETCFMVSISDTPTIKYWQNLESMMDKSKEKIPKKCRIGDTCFTTLADIGGNLFTRNLKNLNHVHKESNDLLAVIIILVTNAHGGKTVFNNGENMNDIGKRAHVLKHSRGRSVVGTFDKILHEGIIWTGHRAVLYFILHKSIFLHFVYHGTIFHEKYITSHDGNKYIDNNGSDVFQNKRLGIYTIQNIKRLIQIDIMFLKMTT